MKIILVTDSLKNLTHGIYDDDKKTRCGINITKADNVSRYQKGNEMNYLGEITCPKCKNKIAKEMIKADSKKMKALLKEERLKSQNGTDDDSNIKS